MVGTVLGHLTATPTRKRWLADLTFAGVLIALVWMAYTPSQKHAPRADHLCFLVDTMKFRGIPDSVAGCYSYNRTRLIAPGDTDLYRPVLFALLATEQWVFAGDLWVYQTIGMILHCTICLLLLCLLRQLAAIVPPREGEQKAENTGWPRTAGDYLPYALTGFFALNPAVQELVIWTHLHGYLLYLVLQFGSLVLLLRHATGRRLGYLGSFSLWGAWVLALIGAFTYEMGQFYAVLAGLFLAAATYPRAGLLRSGFVLVLFTSILPIYQANNQYDSKIHRGTYVPDNAHAAIRKQMFKQATLTHSARFAVYTAVQPFCPSMLESSFSGGRLQIAESLWSVPSLRNWGPEMVVSGIVLVLMASLAAIGLCGLVWRGHWLPILILILLAGIYGLYGAMTVLGRMNLRPGPGMLVSNCYYTYTALVLFIPLLFMTWQGTVGRVVSTVRVGLVGGLVLFTFVGAEQVWRVNLNVAQAPITKDTIRSIHAVNSFVKAHRREPDFSIAIDYESSDDVMKHYHVRITDAIFYRWISNKPKYWIAIRDGKPVLLPGCPPYRGVDTDPDSAIRPGVGLTSRKVGGLASRSGSGANDGWE